MREFLALLMILFILIFGYVYLGLIVSEYQCNNYEKMNPDKKVTYKPFDSCYVGPMRWDEHKAYITANGLTEGLNND